MKNVFVLQQLKMGHFSGGLEKKVLLFCHVKLQNSWADGREKYILAGDMIHYEQLSFVKGSQKHSARPIRL